MIWREQFIDTNRNPIVEPQTDLSWGVLRDPSPSSRVEVVGTGTQRRGKIARGNVRRPREPLVALPSLDDLSS